jgi:transitional endoplasmic reticulum ATPase
VETGPYSIGVVLVIRGEQVIADLGAGRLCLADYQGIAEDDNLETGDVVMVDTEIWDAYGIGADPRPETRGVGVVRDVLEGEVIIEFAGGMVVTPASSVPCVRGNTVEASEKSGVIRVLSERPLHRFGDRLDEPKDASEYRYEIDDLDESFADVGGLQEQVGRARELIDLSLNKRDKLERIGGRPIRGILFTGPPGTGKTMLARVIAKEAGASFFQIKGPQIFSKWVGESEEMLRGVFELAAKEAPSIIFFDEIDAIAARRGETHETGRHVVAQLLTEMDGFSESRNVVVIAATNRKEFLDPALLRPGRFDWQIPFEEPDEATRHAVLNASGRRVVKTQGLPLQKVAAETHGWSAARLAAIWSEAALLAVADERDEVSREDFLGGYLAVANRPAGPEPLRLVPTESDEV